jgi:endonuclease/exonuclease/phosphatase family metal-dependent hydrolase
MFSAEAVFYSQLHMNFHHSIRPLTKKHGLQAMALACAAAALFVVLSGCSRKNGNADAVRSIASKDTLVVGFYNVENLFDLNYDGTEYPEYRPGALGWNKQTWEKKVANIASVIIALNADVIGLCEVENRTALQGLRQELDKRGAAYPYAAIADMSGRGAMCTALLSRFPITQSLGFGSGGESTGRRDILEADIDCNGTSLKLFVNHWPSKKHSESHRLAAARSLAERLQRLPPQTDYAIIGDLNADYDEWRKFHTELLDDTRGVTGINHLLKTVHGKPGKFISYVTRREMAGIDSARHCDLWLELPEEQRWSYKYQGQPKTPDHILLPKSLFDRNGWSYLEGSFTVFTWDGKLLKDGEPFAWQMKGFGPRRVHTGEGYSDHLPLRAVFIKNKVLRVPDSAAGPSSALKAVRQSAGNNGFEKSMEGWLASGRAFSAVRDSSLPASGRYCLKIRSASPPGQNRTAARTVLCRDATNRERRENITLDIRGSGKLSLRARSGKGQWRYYNAPAFVPSGSARYLPIRFTSWRHVELPFIYDNPASQDLTVEIRAGKGMSFCFWVDNVAVQ